MCMRHAHSADGKKVYYVARYTAAGNVNTAAHFRDNVQPLKQNECADDSLNNCDANATCTDNDISFTCECNVNYIGDGVTCTIENDWCDDVTCDVANTECVNKETEGVCECSTGFTADGDIALDGSCVALVNECTAESHTCHEQALCTDTPLGFDCDCSDGYTGNGFDDTVENSTGCTIVCPTGHSSSDNLTCEDDDECALTTDDCPPNEVCVNTSGSFECILISDEPDGVAEHNSYRDLHQDTPPLGIFSVFKICNVFL